MLGEIRGEVRFKEPLSFHTSLRIGGPADIFVVPQDVEDIRLALGFAEREHLPVEIMGGGNNLLVRDRGIRGVVVKIEGCLGRAEFHGEEAVAGAGVGLSALIREAAALNLGGIECLVGIPATIGGAVAMNAGTADGWIGDFISAVYFLHPDGTLGEFKPGNGSFGYRDFTAPAGAVVVGARLQMHRRPQAEIQKEMKQRLKLKKATQPLALASAPLPVRVAPVNPERLVLAYGDELLTMARTRPEIVVLDADLLSDCGIEAFKAELPGRFIAVRQSRRAFNSECNSSRRLRYECDDSGGCCQAVRTCL